MTRGVLVSIALTPTPTLTLALALAGAWWLGVGEPAPDGVERSPSVENEAPRVVPPRLIGREGAEPPSGPPPFLPEGPEGLVSSEPLWGDLVTIRVVSEEGGMPIADACVRVEATVPSRLVGERESLSRETQSDARGMARLPRPRRAATWWARKPGYRAATFEVAGDEGAHRVTLVPAPSFLGVVVDAAGRPLPGTKIEARWVDDLLRPADLVQTADADGRFEIAGVPEGTVVAVVVVHAGFATASRRVARSASGLDPLRVVLGEGAEVGGVVRTREGEPVAGADVYLVDRGEPTPLRPPEYDFDGRVFGLTHALSGPDGRYLVRGVVAPADVVVYARAPDGAEGRSEPLPVKQPGGSHETDLVVSSLGSIAVVFVDAGTGEGISPHDVRCSLDAPWMSVRPDQKARGDAEAGVARLRDVPTGRHEIHVDSPDFLTPPPVPVQIRPMEATCVEIALAGGVSLTGHVVDVDGRPLEVHVTFEATWRGVWQYQGATTDEAGKFTFRGLPPVEGELCAVDEDGCSVTWKGVLAGGDLGWRVFGRGAALVGRMPDSLRDTPIVCGVLSVSGGGVTRGLDVDDEVRFRVAGFDAGTPLHVSLRPRGRTALVLRDLVLDDGEQRRLGTLVFPERHDLEGIVLDAEGWAVPLALVRTVELWCDGRTRTDDEGRFRLANVPPGASTLQIEAKEGGVFFHAVDVAREMDPVTIRLPRPATLVCTMRRQDGRPLVKAPANVFPRLDTGVPDWSRRAIAWTDDRGVFAIALAPGLYGVNPHASNRVEVVGEEPSFVLRAGQRFELEIVVR